MVSRTGSISPMQVKLTVKHTAVHWHVPRLGDQVMNIARCAAAASVFVVVIYIYVCVCSDIWPGIRAPGSCKHCIAGSIAIYVAIEGSEVRKRVRDRSLYCCALSF